jgi:hypothetical protein
MINFVAALEWFLFIEWPTVECTPFGNPNFVIDSFPSVQTIEAAQKYCAVAHATLPIFYLYHEVAL